MDLVERWWNRAWGSMSRLDVWLEHEDGIWYVSIREGTGDSPRHRWHTVDQHIAREWVDELIATSGVPRERWVRLDDVPARPADEGKSA